MPDILRGMIFANIRNRTKKGVVKYSTAPFFILSKKNSNTNKMLMLTF